MIYPVNQNKQEFNETEVIEKINVQEKYFDLEKCISNFIINFLHRLMKKLANAQRYSHDNPDKKVAKTQAALKKSSYSIVEENATSRLNKINVVGSNLLNI